MENLMVRTYVCVKFNMVQSSFVMAQVWGQRLNPVGFEQKKTNWKGLLAISEYSFSINLQNVGLGDET